MKKSVIIGVIVVVLILIVISYFMYPKIFISPDIELNEEIESNMQIKSVFENEQSIPAKYTADGDNINPPLQIVDIPENAKSLVLVVDDPDASSGDWVHWVVFNIPISNAEISENSVPGTQGENSFRKLEYGGPSPPSGTHRYFFKVYALDSELELVEGVSKEEVETAMEGHVIESAELIGLYSRE